MRNKVSSAGNQQGSLRQLADDPSETTRRASFLKAYLLGTLHDGTFSSNRRFRISQSGTDWLRILQRIFKKLGYNSWIYKEGKDRNVYVLETLCKKLNFSFDPLNLTAKEKIAYIKGFFDAEGGMPHKLERFYIQLVQKDFKKIQTIKDLLNELGIGSGKIHNPSKKVDPDYWRIFIPSKDYKKFAEIINSFHPLKAKIFRERMKI